MSEMPNKPVEFESSIERKPMCYIVNLGGEALKLTLENAALYQFAKPYDQFDHVFRKDDEGPRGKYFLRLEHQQLWDELDELGWSLHREKYPSLHDEQVYLNRQSTILERDLTKFSTSGEI